jgi:transcriptional regulator with XRE-family HTH domain
MRNNEYRARGDLNPFLKKINEILAEKEISPSNLSKMAGLGSSTLSNLLKRNNVPSVATLEKICAVIDTPLSSFIKEIEDENPELFIRARSGVIKYDPHSKRKKQIMNDWSALPISDRNETMKQIIDIYGKDGDSADKEP